jgi:beta-1,4-mannosyltransferase
MTEPQQLAGLTVLTYPSFPGNPWQEIAYRASRSAGVDVVTLTSLRDIEQWTSPGARAGRLLHMNWSGPISQDASTLAESMNRVREALGAVERFKASGGAVVWSIHNVLPHELNWLMSSVILDRGLARLADRIVIMNPDTMRRVEHLYRPDPSKVVQIDHPSYVGEFLRGATRDESRAQLGLADDDIVSVFVGMIRPYKGLDQLLEAFDLLDEPKQRLLIGGELGPGYSREDERRLFRPRPNLIYRPGRVPDDELQVWMAAADVMVLPYLTGLNISVVSLAASFGLPVAVRELPGLEYLRGESWVAWLRGSGRELIASLLTAQAEFRKDPAGASHAAEAFAAARSPEMVSRRYRDLFAEVVLPGPGTDRTAG